MSQAVIEASYTESVPKTKIGERLERYFFVFILLYAAGALIQMLVQGPVPLRGLTTEGVVASEESVALRAIWAGCYIVAIGLMLRQIALYAYVLREQPALALLAGVILFSTVWAADPAVSLQHAVTVVITMAIGVYLGTRYGSEGVIRLTGIALAIAMVSSLVIMIALPEWGTMKIIHPGAWLGVFAHKNALGGTSLLSILVFAYLMRETSGMARRVWQGLILIALILLAGSGSATSMAGLPVLCAFGYGLKVFRRSKADIGVALSGFVAAVMLAVPILFVVLGAILESFGRDLTFTGRTDLWSMGLESLIHRPLFGYGFDAFWDDHSEFGGAQIRAFVGWDAPNVHNSWIELSLGIGLIGIALFAVVLFGTLKRSIALLRRRGPGIDGFVALYILYTCYMSFNEHVFLVRNDLITILIMAFATASLVDLRTTPVNAEDEVTGATPITL